MASKVKKGFLYYLAWIFFIALAVVCILGSILIFNPGKDVLGLGIRYVNHSQQNNVNKLQGTTTPFNISEISEINFNSGFTNIQIVRTSEYDNLTFVIDRKVVGFANTPNIEYSVNFSMDGNKLNVDVKEPTLWLAFSPVATITMHCPREKSLENIKLNVTTQSGKINIGNIGNYTLDAKELNINSTSGAINLSKNTDIVSGNVNINTKTSNINVSGDVKTTLKIETDTSKVELDSITGNLNLTANEAKAKCNKILGNVSFSSTKGYIYVTELGNMQTKANGNFTAEPDKIHIANVIINKMAGALTLPNSKQSDISVEEIYGEVLINTTSGKVSIKKAYNVVSIETTSGEVNVTQMSANRVAIKTDTGKINASFNNFKTSTLESNKGSINVGLKMDLYLKISYSAKGSIKISWITTSLELSPEEPILTPNSPEDTTNILTITNKTSGGISINNNFSAQ